jgi:hypothetical protein
MPRAAGHSSDRSAKPRIASTTHKQQAMIEPMLDPFVRQPSTASPTGQYPGLTVAKRASNRQDLWMISGFGLRCFVGSFDELAVHKQRARSDEGDQVWGVDRARQ